ncbi:MAG: 30S ribosomal protein S11 [Candidatus Mesenet longicola]|uniref:Small ribosomal subunit protein uS11 n=1 Tax=Candidatus Mesenet longicola TaxID=1892558 RepID=A0A8J3MQ45_9RICK|nr:MAG: 30S ribosomal protein S11 [Candidatus Mesenet longicola]GHM59172.1 MAG: 30S ribosomal protein S11 [Candidatus Mesenet longicola]
MIEVLKKKSVAIKKEKVIDGIAYVLVTFNNYKIVIANAIDKRVIKYTSAGVHGFKGTKKSTPYAGNTTAESIAKSAVEDGMKTLHVVMSGAGLSIGPSKDGIVKAMESAGLSIISIKYKTCVPHNGPRLRKKRRV